MGIWVELPSGNPSEDGHDFAGRNGDMERRPGLGLLVPRAGQGYVSHRRIPDPFLHHGILEALEQEAFDRRKGVPAEILLCHAVDKLL